MHIDIPLYGDRCFRIQCMSMGLNWVYVVYCFCRFYGFMAFVMEDKDVLGYTCVRNALELSWHLFVLLQCGQGVF